MANIWHELIEYETQDLVKRYVEHRFNYQPSHQKILQITSNFIQGREYFNSANNASMTVKPLLIYYGVVALSRGVTLVLNKQAKEENLKPSHGLEINNWNQVIKSKHFEDLLITIGEGTFSELIHATNNRNYLRANSNVVNYSSTLKTPPKGSIVKLKQMIQYFPDLRNEYFVWSEEKLDFAIVTSIKPTNENKHLQIELQGNQEVSKLQKFFPAEYCNSFSSSVSEGELTHN